MGEDEQSWRATFVQLGEHEVRRRLKHESSDRWGEPVNHYAGRWLDYLAKNAEARQHAAITEQTAVQRQAAEASEGAVAEARKANTLAREATDAARDAAASAREANELARESNTVAASSRDLAREANALAEDSNLVAREANRVAREARDAAKTSNAIAVVAAIIAVIAMAASLLSKGG